ncbi:MAG TPA: MmgE/PrpD family protein [Stellaceae bacterium]|nr:MmgE/PrpD family protein [Stellaceae bacterium]
MSENTDKPAAPPSLTAHVAEFVATNHQKTLPADVIELGRKSILDGLGLAIAGAASESGHIVTEYLQDLGGNHAVCSVLGTRLKAPARHAAFANGIAIHAHDFDDTQLAMATNRVYGLLMHPTAPVLAAVLAVAERDGLSGAALTAGYHVGIEVCCKVAEAANPRHYEDGFHTTGTCGTFGAAAGVANMMHLDPQRTASVLGLAASQSAGLRENFGTMTKPFHPGRSAESAVLATDLVGRGFSAARNILEAKRGFYHAACGGYDDHAIRGKLGAPWVFANPGISIKPHPSGSLTHPAMSAMIGLLEKHDIKPEQILQIRVGTNRYMPTTLLHHDPKNELQAKFSMQFSMAILALHRRAGLLEYTDDVVCSPEVRDMMAKVDFYVSPEADAAGFHKMTSLVDIVLMDGSVVKAKADFGKGSPTNPMSWEEVAEKFMDCASYGGLERPKAREVVALVADLPAIKDIRRLTEALAV